MFPPSSHYELLPGLLLGFHGTDEDTAEKVLAGKDQLTPSRNDYDWLGHGIYFWEYSPERALDFATQGIAERKITRGKIKKPAVIGAVIDPKHCLNMLAASALEQLRGAHELLEFIQEGPMPENKDGADLRARYLDCAVIETLHQAREMRNRWLMAESKGAMPPYATVRGAFFEGTALYPGAGFREKTHVQICVRDLSCIKGYFRPITS
jgi:hypothetical protein